MWHGDQTLIKEGGLISLYLWLLFDLKLTVSANHKSIGELSSHLSSAIHNKLFRSLDIKSLIFWGVASVLEGDLTQYINY